MQNSQYAINKGINRPIEFKGIKAQYIAYLCIGLLLLLILFAILYLIGVPIIAVVGLIGAAGVALFRFVFVYSAKYGTHGLMKQSAYHRLPRAVKGRRLYMILK